MVWVFKGLVLENFVLVFKGVGFFKIFDFKKASAGLRFSYFGVTFLYGNIIELYEVVCVDVVVVRW
jgi:hypothetical protein